MTYVIRSVRPDEWRQVKELRLDALRDPVAHLAFLETYEESVARTDAFWQDRTAGAAVGVTERQQIVAMTEDGEWVGSVTVLVELAGVSNPFGKVSERDQGHLVGVFVRPEHRGSEAGVTQGLFDAALAWSWGVGLDRVRLFVHEKNGRAEAFYRKAGFVPTGETEPMPGTTGESQLEFVITRD